MPKPSLQAAVDAGARRLERTSGSARLDAELLLCHVLGNGRAWLHAHAGRPLEDDVAAGYEALLARRAAGEPVAYITGEREFWSLSLAVDPAVLIPRPETETLVLAALDLFPDAPPARVADLGTGCGAVALALATEWPGCRIVATDTSVDALEVAERNAAKHGISSVAFRQASRREGAAPTSADSSWCVALGDETFGLIVSNPPYVAEGDPHLDAPDIACEPVDALVAGTDGLDAIRAIAAGAPERLTGGGWLLLEHGMAQAGAVSALLEDAGLLGVRTWRDLGGRDRVTGGHMFRR